MPSPAPFLLALALLLQSGAETPAPTVRGPAFLCFQLSTFALAEGEQVVEFTGGLHGSGVTIEGPLGRYRVYENEIMRTPDPLGTRVRRENGYSVFRRRAGGEIIYALVTETDGRRRMLAAVSGDALTGGRGDEAIYPRLALGNPSNRRCDHRYAYLWDIVVPE